MIKLRRSALLATAIVAWCWLAGGVAEAKDQTWSWYGQWTEAVSKGPRSSGKVEYMATMELALKGSRLTMAHRYGAEQVARLSGTVTSRRSASTGQIIDVTFSPRRLSKVFAVSTGSLVEGILVNSFHLPGGKVSLGSASAELAARFVISADGRKVDVQWKGNVDRVNPRITTDGWQYGLRGRAASMIKEFIGKRSTRPLRVKGSFRSI